MRKEEQLLDNVNSEIDKTEPEKKKKHKKGSARKIILNSVFYIVIIAMLLGAFIFATSGSSDKSIFGYRIYSVMSGSMTPVYPKGSLVVVKLTKPEDIKVGDDITFYNPDSTKEVWTHRVTQVVTDYGNNGICFRTQGVANPNEDPFVTLGGNVVGVVSFSVPYAGYALDYIQNNIVISIVIIFLALTLIKLIITLIKPNPVKPRYGKED